MPVLMFSEFVRQHTWAIASKPVLRKKAMMKINEFFFIKGVFKLINRHVTTGKVNAHKPTSRVSTEVASIKGELRLPFGYMPLQSKFAIYENLLESDER
jgi:hypothetical protein